MNREMMDDIFEQYMLMKRDAVQNPDIDNDVPMLLYVGEQPYDDPDGTVLCVIVAGGRDDLAAAIAATMARAFIPYWAAVVSDGYVAKVDDVPPEFRRTDGLEDLMQLDGPVKECLTLSVCDHAGESYATSRTYWYDSDGDIWFDDEEGPATNSEGPLVEMLMDITSFWGKSQVEIVGKIMERMINPN